MVREAHRNGIKKPKTFRYPSLKGTDPKFRRNHRCVFFELRGRGFVG
jgi:hypothetical protein